MTKRLSRPVREACLGRSRRPLAVRRQDGFGFIEALLALGLMSVTVLAIGQMIVTGMYVSEVSEDMTSIAALVSEQMETLKGSRYCDLAAGGSLSSDLSGFFDVVDPDGDGLAEFARRWQVVDLGTSKVLDVVVNGPQTATGMPRTIRLTAQVVDK